MYDSSGYFVNAAKLEYVICSPTTGVGSCRRLRILNPCALPSYLRKSCCCCVVIPSNTSLPQLLVLNQCCMAPSPECPNGGLPISCASAPTATTVPSSAAESPSSSPLSFKCFPMRVPSDRPTLAASRLCVCLVLT